MGDKQKLKDKRIADSFFDRRSGGDRREGYEADYFADGGLQRRKGMEHRQKHERRDQYVRIDKWSSICVILKSTVEYGQCLKDSVHHIP